VRAGRPHADLEDVEDADRLHANSPFETIPGTHVGSSLDE
jgi:hypothetical protein